MIIPKKPKAKMPAPGVPGAGMSTARFELGLEILTELDTTSLMALLEESPAPDPLDLILGAPAPAPQGEGEVTAIVGLLASALKGRFLRRLSAVALASEDELEQAEDSLEAMEALVKARGRAPFQENFEAVKGFFSQLGISNLATLVSLAGPMTKGMATRVELGAGEPSPSDG